MVESDETPSLLRRIGLAWRKERSWPYVGCIDEVLKTPLAKVVLPLMRLKERSTTLKKYIKLKKKNKVELLESPGQQSEQKDSLQESCHFDREPPCRRQQTRGT